MIDTLKATGKFEIERATVTKSRVAEFNPDFTKYHVILSNYNEVLGLKKQNQISLSTLKRVTWSLFMPPIILSRTGRVQ